MSDECPRIDKCPMFPLLASEKTRQVMTTLYCKSNYQGCARKKLCDAGQEAPATLLPTGRYLEDRTREGTSS